MNTAKSTMRSTAFAALLTVPIASSVAFAQDSNEAGQADQAEQTQAEQSATPSQDTAQQQSQTGSGEAAGDQQADALVATVGDAEIRGSDMALVVGMLPPELQSQPPQMLLPIALQQLILRELILQEARAQNFADDPEVVALVESTSANLEEDAMVQVWTDREIARAVTDEAVQQAYEDAQAQGAENLPPIDEVRPQIEQYLRQQAMQEIASMLRQDADVVFYDATGRPVEPQPQATTSGEGSQEGATQPSSEAASDQPSDQSSGAPAEEGSDETAPDQTAN